ncbi:uncharacterized protein LOC143579202 [Bidens hawaiensis]|uniref:uncharacterized protein LOC143579202 n=1 Tax=Bidens hawaiensis TaxID=980011 RepID=UPI0040492154
MYIYDTDNEVSNRVHFFNDDAQSQVRCDIVSLLIKELDSRNELVKLFRTAREICQSTDVPTFSIRLYAGHSGRCYEAPSSNCIGAIVADDDPSSDRYDIVIRHKDGRPQRISKLHQLYMPLQYPLLFVYGESGCSPRLRLHRTSSDGDKNLTMNMYYSYQLHDRQNLYALLLRGGRLFQQYLVDAYVCIEESRLDYIRQNQSRFRTEFLQGVNDAIQRGDTNGRDIGKRMILPSSFTGGPRYMYKHYQDALAICRVHGKPQYFITSTCNVKWPEIERYIAQFPALKSQDRPDIIARVFHMKVKSLINFLRTQKTFGHVEATLYTIEFQKRGLPHCHLLLWVAESQKIRNAEQLDNFICAEIPDPVTEPVLHKVGDDFEVWIRLRNNRQDPTGRHLRYVDYLSEYKWDAGGKFWSKRTSATPPAIGRLIYIHPSGGERFFLRMLLAHQRGCQSFTDIRTVNGQVAMTFREACQMLNLLEDDKEWSSAFEEAAAWATAAELRTLFAHMLQYCEISNPLQLWEEHWNKMADDVVYTHHLLNSEDQKQYVLHELELLLRTAPVPVMLSKYGLPLPDAHTLQCLNNRMLLEEKNYDRQQLAEEHQSLKNLLNSQQNAIYEQIMSAVTSNIQLLAFIYGHGGTGKTFLWNTIISGLRSEGKVVLAVAASGIASLLLPAGRTAHSRFKIPLDLCDESTCSIFKNTHLAQLLTETSLIIIWDEAPMNDRRCFESLDRSLKDLLNNDSQLFGGKSVLLGGDFRQTLPIKRKASKTTTISLSLPRSYIWKSFVMFRLTENMRLQRQSLTLQEKEDIRTFSSWLLAVGNGTIGTPAPEDSQDTKLIDIPTRYLIPFDENALSNLINFIYDTDTLQNPSPATLSRKAIVCPTNETTHQINTIVHNMCPGTSISYLSTDSIIPSASTQVDTHALYPSEYLNMLNFNGLPPHRLELKTNSPIFLLRNLNPTDGLCNGTRLIVTKLLPRIIEAKIMTGNRIGHRVYIPFDT